MAFKDLVEAIDSDKTGRDRLIAVYIGVLAVLLAVCGVGGGNAMKDATARNIEAANTWAFFQAKNIRRHELRLQTAEFEVLLATQPNLSDAARALIDEKLKKYRADETRLTSEPDTGEGVEELKIRAKALEVQRDRAMVKDPYFDYGQALLQIVEFEVLLATQPNLTDAARTLIDEKLKKYRADEARLTSEPDTGEGVEELKVRAKALEVQRDRAMVKDPFFDYGQALLQIAIVLASVAIITGGTVLLVLSAVLAGIGTLSTLNGFLLFFSGSFL